MSNFDDFDIDGETQAALANATRTTTGVQLPFDASMWNWRRGDPSVPETSSAVRHFGGWVGEQGSVESVDPAQMPATIKFEEFPKKDGSGTYGVYTTRTLIVAPICRRAKWATNPNSRGQAGAHKSSYVQYLVYLANFEKVEDKPVYTPWSPGVISASGLTSKALDDCFKQWASDTAAARLANPTKSGALLPHYFWMPIGTFAGEIHSKSTNNNNYITPMEIVVSKALKDTDPAKARQALLDRFIGKETIVKMGLMLEQAGEWVSEWKNYQEDDDAPAPAANSGKAKPPRQANPNLDDVPF